MERLTLGDVRSSDLPSVVNFTPTDPRLVKLVATSERRLIEMGKWWGTYGRFNLCADKNCITWPRQFAAIEAIAVCGRPLQIRNEFFEFLESSAGLADGERCSDGNHCCSGNRCGCGMMQLFDRGFACAFADICGTNKKIKVYADVAESSTSQILLQGYDENNNWIRTLVSGVWTDGEYVSINNATPATSTKFFSSLVSVQKPITNGVVRLYEFNTDDSTQRALAKYDPDERRPNYRRSFIGGLAKSDENGDCAFQTVTVMAKLEHISARVDTDWMTIQSIEALKLACQAVEKERNNLLEEARNYWVQAKVTLSTQLRHYLGSGVVVPLRMDMIQNAAVQNLI